MWQLSSRSGARVVLGFAVAIGALTGCSGSSDEPQASTSRAAALSAAGLTAGYAFSEGSGTTTADASANSIIGTLTNGPTWGTGKFGQAVVFDGVNDFINLGNPTPLRITGSMTVSAWINAVSFPPDDAALVSKRASSALGFQLDATVDQGPRSVGFKLTNSSGANMFRYGRTVLQPATWYHVAGVYDASALTMHVYVNGVLDDGALTGTVTATQRDSTQNVAIGTRPGANGFAFRGSLDDVRIYSRALSVGEIATDMANSAGAPPDATPPVVSVLSPAANAVVGGTVTVTASASDNVAVSGVQFLLDGSNLGAEATSSPYSVSWNTTALSNGAHTLTARARDAAGNSTTSTSVPVTVSNPPRLIISQPVGGSLVVGSSVAIAYSETGDLTGVAHAQFQLDGGALLRDPTFDGAFQLTGIAPGSHTLLGGLLLADDTLIAGSTTTVNFNTSLPDTTPPTVALTAPAGSATVSGVVTVSATAADDIAVVGVQFLVDGAPSGAEVLSAPYAISWDSRSAVNGTHVLSARARDAAGNVTTSGAVSVTVSNAQPTGLLAGYALDEGTGTSAADVTTNNLLGTLTNGPTWGAGMHGQAVVFDGVNDFINLGNPTPLRITGSMTVSAWINAVGFPPDDATVISKRDSGSLGFQFDTTLDQGPRTIGFKLTNASGAKMARFGSSALQVGSWYHIAGVYDAAALALHVYLNGQLNDGVLSGTVTSTQRDSTQNVAIGTRPGLAGFAFHGSIDDVRIYGRALSQAEISTDMNASLGVPADSVAPQVSITSPSANAQVSASVTVSANATDNVGVSGVQFLLDGAALGAEDTAAPYSVVWNAGATPNGAHVLSARARDAAGNATVSTPVSTTVFNPPLLVITQPVEGSNLVTSTLNVSYSTSGDLAQVAKVNFQLDGGPVLTDLTLDGAFQIAGIGSGAHTLNGALARADGSNITGSETVRHFTTTAPDVTPPSVALTAPANGATVNGALTVSATALDDIGVVGVQFLLDGAALGAEAAAAPYSVAWDATSTPNGAHVLSARARDAAGNATVSVPVSITVFNPPLLVITQPVEGSNFVASTLNVSYSASGDLTQVALVNFQLDGGPVLTDSTLDGAFQIAGIAAGAHTLNGALARADGSNITGSETVRHFTTTAPDVTAPTVALSAPASGATVNGTVTVSANASDDIGVVGVQFLLDGAALSAEATTAPYSVAWNSASTANGVHVLSARARDAAGNATVSTPVSVTVFTPPILTISQPVEGSTLSASTLNVAYSTSGDLTQVAQVNFQLDGGAVLTDSTVDGAFQIASVAAGAHTLTGALARADGSNITGSETVRHFTTTTPDLTPPTVALSAPAAGASVNGTVTVSATASDNIGVVAVQFLLDGANLGSPLTSAPYNTAWNTSTAALGSHTLSAVATDAAGNSANASITVTVSNPTYAQVGQWSAVAAWPIVAVHAALLPTGNVLAWTDYTVNSGAQIWRPASNTFTAKTYNAVNLFCAGHAYMPDGRLLVVGGIKNNIDDLGPQDGTIFDSQTETWSATAWMKTGRYYPSATTLADGRILALGGTTTCVSCVADMPEIYDPATDVWTEMAQSARLSLRYYPHPYVLPDGRVLVATSDDAALPTRALDLNSQTWTMIDSRVFDGHSSAMYLPGKILKAGKATADDQGHPAVATAYILDMTQPSPAWQPVAPMAFPRSYLNLTVLPDGTVLTTGGGTTTDKANYAAAIYEAELWSPATQTWTTMARMASPRLYHSTALLLPDARVLVAGGGRENGRSQPDPKDQQNAEIYSPPYLFRGPRPVISSAPQAITYGSTFTVSTPDAARVGSISLIALSAVTHAYNENQRFVPVSFTANAGSLDVAAPASGNLAPPGPYMLFLVDSNGVPSVAAMVRVGPALDTTPPTAPSNLTASSSVGQVGLAWSASTDDVGVTGYSVYRSTTTGFTPGPETFLAQSPGTSYADTAFSAAGTYYYQVTARDARQNISPASSEASAVVSLPTVVPGLVAAYSFGEGSGSTVGDGSGNNLTGTIAGATWTTAGKYGSALSFNGSSSYVDLGNPTKLQLTGSITLEGWVLAAANPVDDGQIVAKSDGLGWQLKTTPDTGVVTFGTKMTSAGGVPAWRYSQTVRALQTWYHAASVYDASAGSLTIYVNGVADNGVLRGTIPPSEIDQAVNVNIGRRTGGYYFNGTIDEIRIYNRALSQSEIQADMNTPIGP